MNNSSKIWKNSNGIQFILYQLSEEEGKIQVVIKDETIWVTQKAMAALFDVGVPDISKYLKKKYETGELDRNTTIPKMETVVNRGFRGEVPEEVHKFWQGLIFPSKIFIGV